MFGKLAADALGLSDIGSVIHPSNYDKADSDDYVLHEDNEKIYFLIKSKSDEYCFTNLAFIHLDGTSAVSKKRTLHRYPYGTYSVSNVSLETAGTVDLDVEIKFNMGSNAFSIDVNKKDIEQVKDLYKALIKIAEITKENQLQLDYSKQSLELATSTVSSIQRAEFNLSEQFVAINKAAFEWMTENYKKYKSKDFGAIFERYINL